MSVPYFLLNRWVSLNKTFTDAATVNIYVVKKHLLWSSSWRAMLHSLFAFVSRVPVTCLMSKISRIKELKKCCRLCWKIIIKMRNKHCWKQMEPPPDLKGNFLVFSFFCKITKTFISPEKRSLNFNRTSVCTQLLLEGFACWMLACCFGYLLMWYFKGVD